MVTFEVLGKDMIAPFLDLIRNYAAKLLVCHTLILVVPSKPATSKMPHSLFSPARQLDEGLF